jgi:hypothetical protein
MNKGESVSYHGARNQHDDAKGRAYMAAVHTLRGIL